MEQLVGMQAQEPQAPYVGLWSRRQGFDPQELSAMVAERRAVRGSLMRWTIHLVSAADFAYLWPLLAPVLARGFAGSPFSKQLAGAAVDEVVAAGAVLLAQRPHTRAELGQGLAERWPEAEPAALAMAATVLAPVVQVPPRGLWQQGGPARWAPAEPWLGRAVDADPSPEPLIRRYLAAFGPASVRDIQAWSGLTRLAPVIEAMRPELATFRDEQDTELFDLPDAPRPDPNEPAPPRFLAPFDNAILAHADRARIIAPAHRQLIQADRLMRTFLIDGHVAGTWHTKGPTLRVSPFAELAPRDRGALATEAEQLAAFLVGREGRANIGRGGRRGLID